MKSTEARGRTRLLELVLAMQRKTCPVRSNRGRVWSTMRTEVYMKRETRRNRAQRANKRSWRYMKGTKAGEKRWTARSGLRRNAEKTDDAKQTWRKWPALNMMNLWEEGRHQARVLRKYQQRKEMKTDSWPKCRCKERMMSETGAMKRRNDRGQCKYGERTGKRVARTARGEQRRHLQEGGGRQVIWR